MKLQPRRLGDVHVGLEPFEEGLAAEVRAAVDAPDPAWRIMATTAEGEHFPAWWEAALRACRSGERIAYAVRRRRDGRVVGTTSFLHISQADRSAEIGSTYIQPDARSGAVNPAMKRLMLEEAFRAGALRVEFRTDARNFRSQAAIAKLGAHREGMLRRQKRTWTGEHRDTVVFSILAEDWPAVRSGLDARLGDRGAGT